LHAKIKADGLNRETTLTPNGVARLIALTYEAEETDRLHFEQKNYLERNPSDVGSTNFESYVDRAKLQDRFQR